MTATHKILPRSTPAGSVVGGQDGWRRRIHGEPSLSSLLEDPILALLMRRDGVTPDDLRAVIAQAQASLWTHPPLRGAA